MLDGWYCRSMANEHHSVSGTGVEQHSQEVRDDDELEGGGVESGSDDENESQVLTMQTNADSLQPSVDYRAQYSGLKKKLKFLLYENEFFQDALRSSQRRLLKVTRDRSFLLDRLVQYEKPDATTSESEDSGADSSDDEGGARETKRRKMEFAPDPTFSNGGVIHTGVHISPAVASNCSTLPMPMTKRKKSSIKKTLLHQVIGGNHTTIQSDGHMTAEEVERHLQSRQPTMELVPERAPPTVPTEMFSNEPSLDSESNDQLIETSPSNIGEDCYTLDY